MRPRRRTSSATKLSLDARLSLCFPAWAALVPLARSQFIPRNFSGIGNNVANPTWGAAETTQIRSVAGADYADTAFTPPGEDRPSAREVMTEVLLPSAPDVASQSTLFVAWGQLVTYDISLTVDNSSEPFDIPCDDGGGVADVWCPLGADSDAIPFFRSDAEVDPDGVRNPTNYATAYLDLDFVYGRSEEEADALRTQDGGLMSMTDAGLPVQNADGTWLIADQRTAEFPVTFALHTMFLLEHNRCCVEVAPDLGFEGDEDLFQACRGWNIALFQHITENDFLINLLGQSVDDIMDSTPIGVSSGADDDDASTSRRKARRGLSSTRRQQEQQPHNSPGESFDADADTIASEQRHSVDVSAVGANLEGDMAEISGSRPRRKMTGRRRSLLYEPSDYDPTVNPAADVFASTAGAAAFASALPPTVRIVSEGYFATAYDGMELTVAREDLAGLLENVGVGDVLRGAVLSPAMTVGTHHAAAISNLSPLFKIPVDAVQRGRDYGLPTYNAARAAYGLDVAADFSEVTSDTDLADLLSTAYGGDIDNLDAYTGALAETADSSTGGVFGELLFYAWMEQLRRTVVGDRLHYLFSTPIEDATLNTLSDVIERTLGVSDLPLSTFQAPSVAVCAGSCSDTEAGETVATLSDSFSVSWEVLGADTLAISLSARGLGEVGYVAMGWGGLTMASAQDYVICEVLSATEAQCTDRAPVSTRNAPPLDAVDPDLEVTAVTINADWTTVTFLRAAGATDDQDYDLGEDLANVEETELIYAFREGSGVGQHPSANRGSSTVNFALGSVENNCEDSSDFILLHGTLMLIAWMIVAPLGIFFVRYRKGENVKWAGKEWYVMHEELMILASEAVLPLGITAVFASGGGHDTEHARWGYYMIAAVALQVLTGKMRVKALEAKQSNFSLLHRLNKHFHIWAGRFAYLAGIVQCYYGLELVAGSDNLVVSIGDGLDLEIGSFDVVAEVLFPIWFALISVCLVYFETRKQYRQYVSKGHTKILGVVEIVNKKFGESTEDPNDRLIPRTETLPIYSIAEFNDKVLNGQSWVLVDGAILDVSEFAQRHPGGRRLILNVVGTDVTHEILGENRSVGHAMAFSPHEHTESAWVLLRELVVGYIEEEEEEDEEEEGEHDHGNDPPRFGSGGEDQATQNPLANVKRVFGQARAVLLPGTRQTLVGGGGDMDKTAKRLNVIAVIPDESQRSAGRAPTGAPRELSMPMRPPKKKSSRSSMKKLEMFHVCPLLFRERMDPGAGVGGSGSGGGGGENRSSQLRPVYRYIFSCPGQAQALVQAITGVCYFNMRCNQERGKGVIQRSYNAYAVRVQDSELAALGEGVEGGGEGGGSAGAGAGRRTVVPAQDTNNSSGMLCIEVRIRLYHDGAMSKLLESLAKDTDNPSVQLQGPFVIQQLIPPPAYPTVVMIAAGTGINPMVQQIRDYLAVSSDRDSTGTPSSRLRLLWQNTTEEDFYGIDELTQMQATSNGLLEVTALISGQHRKFNVPGARATARKSKKAATANSFTTNAGTGAPTLGMYISRGSSTAGGTTNSISRYSIPRRPALLMSPSSTWRSARKPNPAFSFPEKRENAHWWLPKGATDAGSGVVRGKINRDVLAAALGEDALALAAAATSGRSAKPARDRGYGARNGEEKGGAGAGGDENGEDSLEALVGNDSNPAKLQVVVSGPAGFVLHVDNLLSELGIPTRVIVFLD